MKNNEVFYMPHKIYRNTFFKKDTHEVIKEEDIEDIIKSEVQDFYTSQKEEFRENYISKITKNLERDFIDNYLKEFVNNSYLIKIKQGEIPEEDTKEYTVLNKVIRKITKDRPNDFSSVISSIVEIINNGKYSTEDTVEEEIDESTVDDELSEAIKKESQKTDRLTKYINETTLKLYSLAKAELKEEYKKHYDKFLEENKGDIEAKVEEFKSKFTKDLLLYEEDLRDNITNLFNYVLSRYVDRVSWIDDGKYITMVSRITKENKFLVIKSGTVSPKKIKINIDNIERIHRDGNAFTIIIKGNCYE